ncbi:trehalose-phosphatase [Gordonia sp. VNQ95]|uniref:trehalose-phosphatase n=1 Tax=Gordonia TaxID=2053 RepID=UPI0032B3F1CF
MSATDLPAEVHRALENAATAERLLLASDYDGCIAPIVSRPQDAVPLPESIDALRAASVLERTWVAVISGRALSDLAARSGLGVDADITLIGSHGSEFDTGFEQPVTAGQHALLDRIVDEFTSIAAQFDGVTVETKPISTALHVRNAAPDDAAAALDAARRGPASWPGVEATEGKAVIELAVIKTSKGLALDFLRERTGADVVIYLGDDVTDEKAFAHLRHGQDVSIKVGGGDTAAEYRIGDPHDVAAVLALVAERRRTAVAG